MRVTKITVTKLFGTFDYEIDMKLDEHITLLIAPNGYGKTKILEMLYGLFTRDYDVLERTPFEKYVILFDTSKTISIERVQSEHGDFQIQLKRDNGEPYPLTQHKSRDKSDYLQVVLEQLAPVRQISPRRYRDLLTSEILTLSEVQLRYGDVIPSGLIQRDFNSEIDEIVSELDIKPRFIRTQRLGTPAHEAISDRNMQEDKQIAVVRYQKRLSREIERILALSTEMTQSLDSTFPKRLMNRLNSGSRLPNFSDEVKKLNKLNERRREIADLGLVNQQTEDDEITSSSSEAISDFLAVVLAILREDSDEKLAVFDDLLQKIKIFRDIVNKRFQFKQMRISKNKGYEFFTNSGQELSPSHLSSGEQHELIMLYELLFETTPNTLVIIDEPELSLHIDWQKEFLPDLRAIIDIVGFDALIATHSPDIIQGETELLVDLGQMVANDG